MKKFTSYAVLSSYAQSLLGNARTEAAAIKEARTYDAKVPTDLAETDHDDYKLVPITAAEARDCNKNGSESKCFSTLLARAHGL